MQVYVQRKVNEAVAKAAQKWDAQKRQLRAARASQAVALVLFIPSINFASLAHQLYATHRHRQWWMLIHAMSASSSCI